MSAHALRSGVLVVLACGALACRGEKVVTQCAEPLSVVVAPASHTISPGETAVFHVKVLGGFCYYPGPQQFTWSVSNAAVATITSTTDSCVVLTATGVGTATVTASAVADLNVKSAGLLTVVPGSGGGS